MSAEVGAEVRTEVRGDETPVRARPGLRTVALRFALVGALLAVDLWTKKAVFAWLEGPAAARLVSNCCEYPHERLMVLGEDVNWFSFMLSRNPGAAFGGFADWPRLLVGGRILAGLFLIWLVVRTPRERKWFALALVLVLSGALGNLYDNLLLDDEGYRFGRVRDFIDVYFGVWNYHFPTFNFADSCITVGAVLLLLTGLGGDSRERESNERRHTRADEPPLPVPGE